MNPKDLPFTISPKILWIAQDPNGNWWGYTAEPHQHDYGWYENEVGENIRLGETAVDDWRASLTRIK